MKNIHILPTDKPSRLSINCETDLLQLGLDNRMWHDDMHIYITSDEEIKEGDWVLWLSQNKIIKCEDSSLRDRQDMVKKIILTTDQDLIKDGVQAIDDDFLEWYVKNPSCEFAHLGFKSIIGDSETKTTYKIIIPKEEPKQETLEEAVYKFYPEDEQWTDRYVFKLGAKWQAERMYSEEEAKKLIVDFLFTKGIGREVGSVNEWFEQFKKK